MSPIMEPDFDWVEDVQASVPIFPKGDYEVTIKGLRGSAWPKRDKAGNPTGDVTKVIRLRPEIVGAYDSKGKLKGELDGKEIKGTMTGEANLWIHSKGGREQAKRIMGAIAGYNMREPAEEEKFNQFLKKSGLDLSTAVEERDEGEGLTLKLGEGWEKLLVGKNVRVHMEPETYKAEGREPVEQQNFVSFSPVNQ